MSEEKKKIMPTNSQVARAGDTLRKAEVGSTEYKEAVQIVNQWRKWHAIPMIRIRKIVRKRIGLKSQTIVVHRLKRLPTIIDKLSRHSEMNLSKMQDVAGVRAIVNSRKDVYSLRDKLVNQKIGHDVKKVKDYIEDPKPDGYRGIHIIYRVHAKNQDDKLMPYDGYLVEVQLRTKLQHVWATAVETVGMLRGEAYKSDKGSPTWLEFFALTASVMAIVEDSPVVKEHQKLNAKELVNKVAKCEKTINALSVLAGMNTAINHIETNSTKLKGAYNLIELNVKDKTVKITSFKVDQYEAATEAYAEVEEKAAEGTALEAVLVSSGDIKTLRKAYPNYFLDITAFIDTMRKIIELAD